MKSLGFNNAILPTTEGKFSPQRSREQLSASTRTRSAPDPT
jgi:hypothetical protein